MVMCSAELVHRILLVPGVAHDNTLMWQSASGLQATFSFHAPAATAEPTAMDAPADGPGEPLHGAMRTEAVIKVVLVVLVVCGVVLVAAVYSIRSLRAKRRARITGLAPSAAAGDGGVAEGADGL